MALLARKKWHTVNPLYLASIIFSVFNPKCISVLLIWRLADQKNVVRYMQCILGSF